VSQPREPYSTYRELARLGTRVLRLEQIALLLIAQVPPDAPHYAELQQLAEAIVPRPREAVERNDLP
jgi:hypothetical protein